MLDGQRGLAKQMAMRLVLDLAAAANAERLVPIRSAHLSGVSPLTGGLGLRLFLKKLGADADATVAIPTTLNSAGCDPAQFEQMRIVAPDFLAHNNEIVAAYTKLGVRPTQSCIPYEWDGVVTEGLASWAESNAIAFGNSYCDLTTNRESGLSALASALTGYAPEYGLLVPGAIRPNLHVHVTATLDDPTDFSILGDWFGTQRDSTWHTPLGPMPVITGLPDTLTHEQRKALTAAAANYGCPQLFVGSEMLAQLPVDAPKLLFDEATLAERYADLAPSAAPSLIVLGCPQASIGELRTIADQLSGKTVATSPHHPDIPLLWVFTSGQNKQIARETGIAQAITAAGALLLEHTCPEVVPYDRSWVNTILTNSMKAEHYIKSGLNGIPTVVLNTVECVAAAVGGNQWSVVTDRSVAKETRQRKKMHTPITAEKSVAVDQFTGHGLPSQTDFEVEGEAFVTPAPITLLGFVNRETGVIEEAGHPADGQSMAGKIAIFPKGSGSSVAPYVLLELFYRGMAPIAICNTQIDQQTAPACSLEGIPYGYGFDGDIIANIVNGDKVRLARAGERVTLTVIEQAA